MISFKFLVDLNREEDKSTLKHGDAALAELVLKHGGKGDLDKLAKEEEKLLFSMIDQSSYSTQASLYTLSQSDMKKSTKNRLILPLFHAHEHEREIFSKTHIKYF
ncbi:MAG: hypothetical protein AAF770_03120 [Bacteroidota bacterium]